MGKIESGKETEEGKEKERDLIMYLPKILKNMSFEHKTIDQILKCN